MKLKQIVLGCCIVGLPIIANGQGFPIGKGASMITGLASFSSTSSSTSSGSGSVTTVTFSPSMDYFLFNHFFVGGGLSYSSQTQNSLNVTGTAIGPEIGYAFGKPDSKVFPYLNAGWNYLNSKVDESYYGSPNLSGSDLSFGFGFIIPVKSHFGLVLQGKYDSINYSGSSQSVNVISLNFGVVGLLF